MEFTEWIQMSVREQLEYLKTTPDNEVLMFITHLCTINIENYETNKIYIERNRILQRKLNSRLNLKSVRNGAMKEMCKLCKAEMEDR